MRVWILSDLHLEYADLQQPLQIRVRWCWLVQVVPPLPTTRLSQTVSSSNRRGGGGFFPGGRPHRR
jgi:hypothetical protein